MNFYLCTKGLRAAAALATVVAFALLVTTPAFSAGTSGTIIAFDPPGSTYTDVRGIDSAGLVAGTYKDANSVVHGFTRDASGVIVSFDAPGAGTDPGEGTEVEAISEGGQICGDYIDSNTRIHGFLMSPAGVITTFTIDDSEGTFTSGVNDSGQVVGAYFPTTSPYPIDFVWTANGGATTFSPPGSSYALGGYINSSGALAGLDQTTAKRRGYYESVSGNFIVFDGSATATGTYPEAINDSGSIAGFYTSATGYFGFLRQGSSISKIDIGDFAFTEVWAINNVGTVTGFYGVASGAVEGFFQDKFGNVTYITVPYAGTAANQGTFPTAINAAGRVAGYFAGPDGNYHGFLWR
jgi:hypothetical protein